jgi:putative oxidoreductase
MDTVEAYSVAARSGILNTILLILRISIGIIMCAHGGQKMFGWFGGHGLASTVQLLGSVGYLVAIGEFFGGLGILLGFLTRFSAFWLIVIQIGAIVKVHWANGFFLGQKPGFEYNFALISIFVSLLIAGPGRYAIIRWFSFLVPAKLKKILKYIE